MDGIIDVPVENVGPQWTDAMCDIETTGLNPDRSGILQIACVKFNLRTREICPDVFNKSLTLPAHRAWNEDTRNWWLRDKRTILQDIMNKAEPYRDVMQQFADFGYQNPGLRFWAKPTHFDHSFVSSYFNDEGLPNPFHFRVARDLNTYLEGIYYPNPVPKSLDEIPFVGPVHNALYDTFHQIKVLFAAQDEVDNVRKAG